MFSLVRFLGDNFYHICSKGDTKSINGITLAKWRGNYYEAKLITSSEDYNILQSFCNNLLNKYPIVEIQRFDQNLSEKELYQDLFQEKKMPQEQPDKISSNVSKRDLAIEETSNDTIEVDAEYNSDPDPFDTDEDSSYVPHTSESSDSSVEYSLNKIDLLSLTSPKGWKEPLLHVQTDLPIHGVPYLPLHMRNRPSEVSSNLESDRRLDVPLLNIESNMQLDVPAHYWNDDCSLSIATLSSQDDFSLCYICGDMVQNLGAHVNIHNVALETLQESPKKSVLKDKKRLSKLHYCLYCGQKQAKLVRHLERRHSSEEDVIKAVTFKKKSLERIKIFDKIRKNGDFLHNEKCSEQLVTVKSCKLENSLPCPYCRGYYSRKNLQNHIRLTCEPENKESRKKGLAKSRMLVYNVHPEASEILKKDIFVNMKHDNIFETIIQDETIVQYANMMLIKYSSSFHHHKMIAQHLRQMSKLLITVKNINSNVHSVKDMLSPCYYDDIIKAIHQLAGLENGQYRAPSVANHSCTLIAHFVNHIKYQSIRDGDEALRKKMDDFNSLMKHSQNAYITKIAGENRTHNQRIKNDILPTTEEIKHLFSLLYRDIRTCLEEISELFTVETYCKLSKLTMITLMIFNRKRPGDIEKTHVIEYENIVTLDEEHTKNLCDNEQKCASTFGRFISRGKLNKPAPSLVSKTNMAAINALLKYREAAGISKANKYLFASIQKRKYPYFKADQALKEYVIANKLDPNRFLANSLRKHLATVTSNAPKDEQMMISDFMGHHIDIHNNIYRKRQAVTDIIKMGKVLIDAVGGDFEIMENRDSTISSTSISSQICNDVANSTLVETKTSRDNFQLGKNPVDRIEMAENMPNTFEYFYDLVQDNFHTDENSEDSIGMVKNSTSATFENSSNNSYQPHDLSVIEEIPHTPKSSKFKKRIRISRQPLLRNSRRTWRTPERKLVREYFKPFLDHQEVPKLHKCQEFIHAHSSLSSRTPQQLRAWISAEIKRSRRGEVNSNRWSTPNKELCRKHFKTYYKTKTYPCAAELQHAIDIFPEFANKTTDMLRSHLQHDYKYVSASPD